MSSESLEDSFIIGSKNRVTGDLNDLSKPFVTRGITQKPEIDFCVKNRRDYYFIDTGYLGNFPSIGNPGGKKKYHRVVKNNIQHCDFIPGFPSDRWNNLVKCDPRLRWTGWKQHKKKILLVIPNPKACKFYGIDQELWVKETVEKIKASVDLPIEKRIKGSRSYRNHEYSIYDAFDSGVYATVSFNSIAALESILYGIPSFVSVPCAASPLASNDLSQLANPYRPTNEMILDHCYRLSYGQFTADEIYCGDAWNILERHK